MIQPAGYIRIMAEELVKNNRSVFGKVVTGVEHVAVGLPFVHLLQPPPGNPDERIEPKETADQLDGDAFRRMAVTDMPRFMAENDHAPATFVSSAQKNRAQMEVVLRADKDAPMADLADVMDASRRAHAFRLKLTAEASDPGIVRMLPPDPLRLPADSADYALPATNRNDR